MIIFFKKFFPSLEIQKKSSHYNQYAKMLETKLNNISEIINNMTTLCKTNDETNDEAIDESVDESDTESIKELVKKQRNLVKIMKQLLNQIKYTLLNIKIKYIF